VIDASSMIVMPGFVDTHRHLWQGLLRNILPDASLSEYLREMFVTFGPKYQPDDVFAGSLVSALGALNAGVTTILDWAHIQNSPQHTDACVAALCESNMRAIFGYSPPPQPSGDLHRVRKQYFTSGDQLVTLALAPRGPEWSESAAAAQDWRMARSLGLRISVHAGTPGARARAFEELGHLELLGNDTTYIHCAGLNETEWKMIADTGGSVSISAPVEMQMGHGMPAVQTSIDHGIRPSLSVDVETSAPGEFFTQMRVVLALQRALANARALGGTGSAPKLLSARDVLEFATIEGARANGLDSKVGTLTPGKQADIVLMRTDLINVMPVNDAIAAVVLGMDTSNVDTVFVAGRMLKQDGRLLDVDMRRVSRLVRTAHDGLLSRIGRAARRAGAGDPRAPREEAE
jgi:cytosine/adenosine deaminase-related metal-dependent hydrolase